MKRITILMAGLITTLIFGTSCKKTEVVVPDYSSYTNSFDFYGYSACSDGRYYLDGIEYSVGESFLTVEQYQMYKDAGMTIFYPWAVLPIKYTGVEGSREAFWEKAKAEIDKACQVGLDKTIIQDIDLADLGINNYEGSLLHGESKKFNSEEELDAAVYELVKLYADYPGVYGVQMTDEPKYAAYESYGEVYNSILRVNKKYGFNLFPQYNLIPLSHSEKVYDEYLPHVEGTSDKYNFDDAFIRYKKYINDFMDSMKPDYIQYDDYPLRNGKILENYLPIIQYIANLAAEKGIEFHMVNQTFDMYTDGVQSVRKINAKEANWVNNMSLGFGVDTMAYFTYFTCPYSTTDGEAFIDGSSFVSLNGEKTPIYDIMQNIMSNNQKYAPTILNFEFKKSGIFACLPMQTSATHLQYVDLNNTSYTKVKSVNVNKECALVNELYDQKNDRYMYMAMNILDPVYTGSAVYETITLEFSKEYKYAQVYRDGETKYYKLKDSKLEIKAAPGEASFVIPF